MTRPHDLAALLAAGEQAAFHGAPAMAVAPLEQAVAAADSHGRPAEAMAATWLLGVTFTALGRYGAALAALEPLAAVDAPMPPEQRLFASLACSTLGTVHRQLGRLPEAHAADLAALALTDGTGEAGFDAVLGLAADGVAAERTDEARDQLDRAASLVADRASRWWRQQVRLDWVRAEADLARRAATRAAEHAAAAVTLAEHANAPGYVAQGLLLLGLAQAMTSPADAVPSLRRAAALADGVGSLPLVWPSRGALASLLREADPGESSRCVTAARTAVRTIAEELPTTLRSSWLSRPDIAALQVDGAEESRRAARLPRQT